MGQKSNPNSIRLGIVKDWNSKWYFEDKKVPMFLYEDFRIRNLIKKHYPRCVISKIEIQRLKKENNENVKINLFTPKVGIVQGAENKEKNKLIQKIKKSIDKEIEINVFEVKDTERNASLIAQSIALQLQQRAHFRMILKTSAQKAMKSGAQGVKILISGRLGGLEIAKHESVSFGSVPLSIFRAHIDYAFEEAYNTYGVIGVKVWIYNGQHL